MPTRTVLGGILDTLLVRGLILLELAWPMPARLGHPTAPAPADADPVILVGGYANNASPGWDEWRRSLEADGYQVFVLPPYSFGLGDMYASARDLAAYIEQVKRRTGRSRVDVIGFSEGGILTRMAITYFGMRGSIDRAISLATPHGGVPAGMLLDTLSAIPLLGSAISASTYQLVRGSELLAHLERADRSLRTPGSGIRYASIHSRMFDLFVTPQSATLPGAINIPIAHDNPRRRWGGPNHFGMYHLSDRAYEAARMLLSDAEEGTSNIVRARGVAAPRAAAITGARLALIALADR